MKGSPQRGRDCSKWGLGRGIKPRASKGDLGRGPKLTATNETDLNGLWTIFLNSSCKKGNQGHDECGELRIEK